MHLEERVEAYRAYVQATVPGARLPRLTVSRLAALGTATELADLHADSPYPLEIGQVAERAGLTKANATYVLRDCPDHFETLKSAMLAESIAASSSGRLLLELRLQSNGYGERDMAVLVALEPCPRAIACKLIPSFDSPATTGFLELLVRPPFSELAVTVFDSSRTFALLDHPLRTIASEVEIAYRVGTEDPAPLALIDPFINPRPRRSVVVASLLKAVETAPVLNPAGGFDLLARSDDHRVVTLTRPARSAALQLDGPRRTRARELARRVAGLLDLEPCPADRVLDWCRPREQGVILEHLYLLANFHAAALAMASAAFEPNQKDRQT